MVFFTTTNLISRSIWFLPSPMAHESAEHLLRPVKHKTKNPAHKKPASGKRDLQATLLLPVHIVNSSIFKKRFYTLTRLSFSNHVTSLPLLFPIAPTSFRKKKKKITFTESSTPFTLIITRPQTSARLSQSRGISINNFIAGQLHLVDLYLAWHPIRLHVPPASPLSCHFVSAISNSTNSVAVQHSVFASLHSGRLIYFDRCNPVLRLD